MRVIDFALVDSCLTMHKEIGCVSSALRSVGSNLALGMLSGSITIHFTKLLPGYERVETPRPYRGHIALLVPVRPLYVFNGDLRFRNAPSKKTDDAELDNGEFRSDKLMAD